MSEKEKVAEADRRAQRNLTQNIIILTVFGIMAGLLERFVLEEDMFLRFLSNVYLIFALGFSFLAYVHKQAMNREAQQEERNQTDSE